MNTFKYISVFALVLALTACGDKNANQQDQTPGNEQVETYPSNTILLTAQQLKQAGIETGTFSMRPLGTQLNVNAELVLGKEHTALVSAFTDGIISELRLRSNSTVAKGSVLAVLRKPDLLDLQQEYLENKDRLVFLDAEYQRYKALKDSDATATKNFQKAESEWRSAQTTAKLIAAKLKLYQIDPNKLTLDNLRTELLIVAPISGLVNRIDASLGQALNTGDLLCEISDLTYLHPVLYVFEKDLPHIKPGQKIQLSFPGDPSQVLNAKVDYAERSVDPDRKTIRVHARLDDLSVSSNVKLTKGSFLNARIELSKEGLRFALPEEAVIQEADGYFIFSKDQENAQGTLFRKIPVKKRTSRDGFVAIDPMESLPKDAAIVLKGAYYISAQGAGVSAEE